MKALYAQAAAKDMKNYVLSYRYLYKNHTCAGMYVLTVMGQAGWGFGQPDLMEDNPNHGRGVVVG